MYQYRKIKARILEKYETRDRFAAALDISKVALSRKLNNKAQFRQSDIVTWARLLEIPVEKYGEYFFQ